jgi:hypothetical protein
LDWEFRFIIYVRVEGRRTPFSSALYANSMDVVADQGQFQDRLPRTERWKLIEKLRDRLPEIRKISFPGRCWVTRLSELFKEDLPSSPMVTISLISNTDPWDLLKTASSRVFPTYFNDQSNLDLYAKKACNHLTPDQAMKKTNRMITKALKDGTELIDFSRFVVRAEDRVEDFKKLANAGVKVRVFSPNLRKLVDGTRMEFDWITRIMTQNKEQLSNNERMQAVAGFGVPTDPIYAWRPDNNSDPHVLGNLFTRYTNLLAIGKMEEDEQLLSNGKFEIYQYNLDYEYGGTFKFKRDNLNEGLGLIKEKGGPGRIAFLYKIRKEEKDLALECLRRITSRGEAIASLADIEEEIAKTAEVARYLLRRNEVMATLLSNNENSIHAKLESAFAAFDEHQSFSQYDNLLGQVKSLKTELCVTASRS